MKMGQNRLEKLVERYKSVILARGRTAKHADDTGKRIYSVLQEAAITSISDLRVTQIQLALGRLRNRNSLSFCSLNHYLRAIKSFSRFLLLDGRTNRDALVGAAPFNAKQDRRHRRRALSLDEIARLLATAQHGPRVRGMSGPERAALYLLALTSGLRAKELRALRVGDILLQDGAGIVRLGAAHTKNRQELHQPIPASTAAAVLAIQPSSGAIFAMPQPSRVVHMLRTDLKAAEIEYEDARGELADFHALRHTYITHLVAGGTNLKTVQSLARHSTITLTMDGYTHVIPSSQRAAVDALGEAIAFAAQWAEPGSNRRHMDFQSIALNPTELGERRHAQGQLYRLARVRHGGRYV